MTSEYNIALYGQSLFNDDDNAKNSAELKKLTHSGFTTMVFFTLHVHPEGELYWGDNPIAQGGRIVYRWKDTQNPSMPEIVQGLRAGGFENVLFSIGSGGPPQPEDWHHIQDLIEKGRGPELVANFAAVAQWLGLDGFDFDCEEDDILASTIATMAAKLAPLGKKRAITFAPYTSMDWWLLCLELIYKQNRGQLVDWLNLQVYGGADICAWLAGLTKAEDAIGVHDPARFLAAGCLVLPPPTICGEYMVIGSLGLTAGILWQSGNIFDSPYPPTDYAAAVLAGLSGQSCG